MIWQRSRRKAFQHHDYLSMDYSSRARPVIEANRQTAHGWPLLDFDLGRTQTNNVKFCLCKALDSGNRSEDTIEPHSRLAQAEGMLQKEIILIPRFHKSKALMEESTQD